MIKFIHLFWQVCTFKLGPQDMPYSGYLLLFSSVAYALVSVMVAALSLSFGQALVSGLLEVALIGAMTQLLLWIRELTARFYQTFIALMGSGAIIGALIWPLQLMQISAGDEPLLLPSLIALGLLVWNVTIVGHILRHAIKAPYFVGIGLALIYTYVLMSVMNSLFTTPM